MRNRLPAADPATIISFWEVILAGGIVAYPTDTLYGFGVDATNHSAIGKLAGLKGRGGPFAVMVGSLDQLDKYALISGAVRNKLLAVLPGPYTFILPMREKSPVSSAVMGTGDSVGFRIPDHPFVNSVFRDQTLPVVSTSINRTGQQALRDPDIIMDQFGDGTDLLVDGGLLPDSTGSTVIDTCSIPWTIVRQGDGVFEVI